MTKELNVTLKEYAFGRLDFQAYFASLSSTMHKRSNSSSEFLRRQLYRSSVIDRFSRGDL